MMKYPSKMAQLTPTVRVSPGYQWHLEILQDFAGTLYDNKQQKYATTRAPSNSIAIIFLLLQTATTATTTCSSGYEIVRCDHSHHVVWFVSRC